MKKGKKIIITTFSIIGTLLIALGITANLAFNTNKKDYASLPKTQNVEHEKIETYKAIGKGIYDLDGNLFQIKGINYGNLLIQEGWMSVNSIGPKLNEDGSYVKINEQGIVEEYLELYQEELDEALMNNPNLDKEKIEELYNLYYMSYCQEDDFKNIKDIGFILANNIANYFDSQENKEMLKELEKFGVNTTYNINKRNHHEFITGKKFVITGTIEGITRDEIKEKIEQNGGTTSDSVSSKTDVLIVGANAGSKLEKAQKLNVEIWDNNKILDILKELT